MYQILAAALAVMAFGHLCQIWLQQNYWPDFYIWQISAQLQCIRTTYNYK